MFCLWFLKAKKVVQPFFIILLLLSICTETFACYSPWKNYRRNLLEKTTDGYYLIQDFYETGEKLTDPFLIKEEEEAKKEEYMTSGCWNIDSMTITGGYTLYYVNGNKMLSGNYQDGRRKGKWLTWYNTGKKESETIYSSSSLVGNTIIWYEDGAKGGEGELSYLYKKDRNNQNIRVGNWLYYQKNSQLLYQGRYDEKGEKQGVWYGYCQGQKYLSTEYENDFRGDHKYFLPKEEILNKKCSLYLKI